MGRVGCEWDVGGAIARRSSACSRGMKPGSISVPPTARMEEAMVLRRSIGTYAQVNNKRPCLSHPHTFRSASRITSATLLSSTSPPSNSTSAARSRIQPGMIRVPRPVPVCCATGGITLN